MNYAGQLKAFTRWDQAAGIYVGCVVYMMCFRAVASPLGLERYASLSLGACVVLCFSIKGMNILAKNRLRLLPEVVLMALWALWVFCSTFFVHDDVASLPFTRSPLLLVTYCVSLFVVVIGGGNKNTCEESLLGLAIGGAGVGLLALITGEVFSFSESESQRLGTALVGNSNDFGYIILLSLFSLSYFAHLANKKEMMILLAGLILLLSALCVLSGSRKALLAMLIYCSLVVLLCHSKKILRNVKFTIYLIVFVGFMSIACVWTYNNTFVGERTQKWMSEDFSGSSIKSDQRFAGRSRFYNVGWNLIEEHPIFGIGLDQYQYHDLYSLPSHSEYVSILAETGVPGAILYFGAYGIILVRLNTQRRHGNRGLALRAGLLLASLLTILAMDLGRWNWDHPPTWILLAACACFGFDNNLGRHRGIGRNGE